jgi:hypothetical protein
MLTHHVCAQMDNAAEGAEPTITDQTAATHTYTYTHTAYMRTH